MLNDNIVIKYLEIAGLSGKSPLKGKPKFTPQTKPIKGISNLILSKQETEIWGTINDWGKLMPGYIEVISLRKEEVKWEADEDCGKRSYFTPIKVYSYENKFIGREPTNGEFNEDIVSLTKCREPMDWAVWTDRQSLVSRLHLKADERFAVDSMFCWLYAVENGNSYEGPTLDKFYEQKSSIDIYTHYIMARKIYSCLTSQANLYKKHGRK